MLHVFYEEINRFKFDKSKFKVIFGQMINTRNKKFGSITLVFCSDNNILNINRQFLQHNYLTDIITFNYNKMDLISGDLFIGIEQVKRNATIFNQDFNVELARVIIHGVLHLLGYDDKENADQLLMTQMENKYLIENGYLI